LLFASDATKAMRCQVGARSIRKWAVMGWRRREFEHQTEANVIWLVRDEDPEIMGVLGVFREQDEAIEFAKEISDRFTFGVSISSYSIGFRYDRGTGFASFEDNGAK